MRTFGLGMMKLDIRQESTRHTEVMDAITRYLGIGSYAEWGEVGPRCARVLASTHTFDWNLVLAGSCLAPFVFRR